MTAVTRRIHAPGLETLFMAAIVLFGFRLGVRPIGDNSMLTHLRTGIDMVGGKGIPRVDPYSFTALDHQWVVQSWLPEWTYGWAHRLGGYRLVVLEQAVLMAVLAFLIVRLARTGSPVRTAVAATIAVGIGATYWSPRPLIFGLICMALLVTIVEKRLSFWWLVPLVWFWVQSHGSFPLGLVWLGARALGEGLDWKAWPRDTVRYVTAFLGGLVVAILNPLGARLLAFPFTLGEKRSVFSSIIEWQSPNFQKAGGRYAVVFLVLALALLVRARIPWRDVVPIIVFLAASLIAVRNVPVAAIVLAPCLGRILKRPESSNSRSTDRPPDTPSQLRLRRVVAAVLAVGFLLFGASVAFAPDRDALALGAYPKDAVTFLNERGLRTAPHRLAHQDYVGNYLTWRHGDKARDFIDDRYDMFPVGVSKDYLTLLGGKPGALGVLDRRKVDVVLWQRSKPLATILGQNEHWREIYDKDGWVIYEREP
ncbi:MAG TPA: hypothetical protein VM121_09560 [Acidimicrobiales bacterium]|nr:hypothetical protein [Acidimicrobiales bacterium]